MTEHKIIDSCIKFVQFSTEAWATNRAEAMEDDKFVGGEQWPAELQNSRQLDQRPCITVNKLDSFCRQVSNQQRQQRPRIKVHPTNTLATKKVADVITGLVRHIETNSHADTAYDTAFDQTVKGGWGFWRVNTNYISDDSFDQDIYIDTIENRFTVYFDPNSTLPDGADQQECAICVEMSKEQFRREYPNKDDGSNFTARGAGDISNDWVTKHDIRIAEYFVVEHKKATLLLLSDGSKGFKDDLPNNFEDIFAAVGVTVVDERESYKKVVKWYKLTAMEILEEKEWAGKYIPIVPVYGNIDIVDGKRKIYGIVRHAKDPARMYNYWVTAATESMALAPKAKWLMAEGQDENHENEWNKANIIPTQTLRYKQKDIDGQDAPPPQRIQPEPPPDGMLQQMQIVSNDIREVIGITDPAMRDQGNVSGKALNAQQMQSDQSTFHFYDNLTRSIQHTGKIILDLIPHIYDTERVTRIIGDDGKPDMITLNGKKTTPEGEVLENDVTVGEYDVVMDIGPGYLSKRLEAVDSLMALVSADPTLMQVAGDLIFRNMDFPGAEVIADRLAAQNPLAQIDDKSDIPPQAQMQIKQLQSQLQQAQQGIQSMQMEMKYKTGIEKMKDEGQTRRALMAEQGKAHDTEIWSNEERAQVRQVAQSNSENNATKMQIEEMKGHIAMLLERMGQNEEATDKPKFPTYNSKGHRLYKDKNGNHAYISERGEVTEV